MSQDEELAVQKLVYKPGSAGGIPGARACMATGRDPEGFYISQPGLQMLLVRAQKAACTTANPSVMAKALSHERASALGGSSSSAVGQVLLAEN
ncbi:MAG: hypothetical protein FRX49_04375 [Trebouxia sp. A1-2]|nr:MAG: hypothetical protein FRX49_04375 [Trebouxia sp. A1-2]